MKKRVGIVRCVVFWLLFAALFVLLQSALIYKNSPSGEGHTLNSSATKYDLAQPVTGFYELPKNSLDAVFVGSSLIYCGVNPNVIWRECGFSSYDVCASAMQLDTLCYVIEDVFRTQSPSVVVVEATFLDAERYDVRDAHAYYTSYSPLTPAKLKFALEGGGENEAAAIIAPLTKYHTRWADLVPDDFGYIASDKSDPLLGFVGLLSAGEASYEEFSRLSTGNEKAGGISDETAAYIERICELCSDGGARPVFVQVPSVVGLRDDRYPYTNALEDYFAKRKIDFIDYNDVAFELGFESGDIADDTHLTLSGAEKFSKIIGADVAALMGSEARRGQRCAEYFDGCAAEYDRICEATENR